MLPRHVLRLRGLARRLSTTDQQTPSKTDIKEPAITLTPKEEKVEKDNVVVPLSIPMSYYLDTHTAVLQLQTAGFSAEQAEVLIKVLTRSLQTAVAPVERSVLSQRDLDVMELRMLKELESVHSKLVLMENSSLESLRRENVVLKEKVERLMSGFKEEVAKVQSNLQLDLNLEKGRIKEEASTLVQDIRDTNNRIDKEVAQLRTQMEAQKLESVKYLAGVSFSVVTIVLSVALGVWRLMK